MNFYNMETFIIERRWLAYARQVDMLSIHKQMTGQCVSQGDFWKSPFSQCPSNDIISKCFLARFLQDEQMYIKDMTAIPTGKSISFDHTFKVAANIGYLREDGTSMTAFPCHECKRSSCDMATNKRDIIFSNWNIANGSQGALTRN